MTFKDKNQIQPRNEGGDLMSTKIETTDRYDALGVERPDPETVCPGQCEGLGRVPVFMPDEIEIESGQCRPERESDFALVVAWRMAEEQKHSTDGYHFVVCPTCGGTGTDLREAK